MAPRNSTNTPAVATDDEGAVTESIVIRTAPGLCACGCERVLPPKPSFIQGHDASLKSKLQHAARDAASVSFVVAATEGGERTLLATDALDERGWPQPAPKKAKAAKATDTEATEEAAA
jgi:hypothetical protein